MRVVFMGTPELAAVILERLCVEHDVAGVFTRPDAVRGRGRELVASPVKACAQKRGLAVYTPKDMKTDEARRQVESLEPDFICVAAYGAILPKAILDIPRFCCLNVHTSLLPRWRGAAPIERAILSRDEKSGVCIMRMEEELDTGPYCAREEVPVGDKYLADLTDELASCGAGALVDAISSIEKGEARWVEQTDRGVTYAHKIEKAELACGPEDDAETLLAKVRASSASRPCRMSIAGRALAVERAAIVDDALVPVGERLEAGSATFTRKRLLVGTTRGTVEIERVRPDGKKSMDGRAFAAGVQGIKDARVTWGRS